MDVGFPSSEIAAFDCVVEKSMNTVAIVLVVLSRIDTALSSDTVSASGTVLIAKTFNLVAKLGQGGSSGSTFGSKFELASFQATRDRWSECNK